MEQMNYKATANAFQTKLYGTVVIVAHEKDDLSIANIAEFVSVVDRANASAIFETEDK
jgi:hypothetical protein